MNRRSTEWFEIINDLIDDHAYRLALADGPARIMQEKVAFSSYIRERLIFSPSFVKTDSLVATYKAFIKKGLESIGSEEDRDLIEAALEIFRTQCKQEKRGPRKYQKFPENMGAHFDWLGVVRPDISKYIDRWDEIDRLIYWYTGDASQQETIAIITMQFKILYRNILFNDLDSVVLEASPLSGVPFQRVNVKFLEK